METPWKISATPCKSTLSFSTSTFPHHVENVENPLFGSFLKGSTPILSNAFREKVQETPCQNTNLTCMPSQKRGPG